MAGLSDDLITKILDRFPKESLIPFRCVSKQWRRLIDDRFFRKSLLYLVPMYSSSLYRIGLRRLGDLVEIENPFESEQIVLLGSCRGFLCIYNEVDGQIAIWNPSTRSCQLLPPADAEIAHRLGPPACVYGFGYDYWNDEFVLLRLVQTMEDPILSVSIYRSRASVWRRLQGIPPYSLVEPRTMGVFLRGRLHWIMRRDPMQNSAIVLVAFDIHTENSVEVQQLNFIDNRLPMYLAILEGGLCLIINDERGGVSAWIASEYGSEESWARLFSIADYSMGRVLLQPLAYSQNGRQVLLLYRETLVWYNLDTGDVEHINSMLSISNTPIVGDYLGSCRRRLQGAWRQLEGMSYSLGNARKRGIFLHGRLHWIMTPQLVLNSTKVLVAFDIRSDKFMEVSELNFIDNRLNMDLTLLGGCLCLIIYGEQRGVHAWIMREYGLNRPWYMLFSMPGHSRPSGLVRLLAYSQNGRQVLVAVGGKTLVWYDRVWYDLHTGGVKKFDKRGMPSSYEAEIYLRTLVPVGKPPI